MGQFQLRQLAKWVTERKFEASEGADTVGFSHSHGDFSLVVQDPRKLRWKAASERGNG